MPIEDQAPAGPLPLLTEPIKGGGGIDLLEGNCAGCGRVTNWYMNQVMRCQICQTIQAYREGLNFRKRADGKPLIQPLQHSDDYLRFNGTCCPLSGRKCANPERFLSFFAQVQGTQTGKLVYNRKYRIARGWATPMNGECKCNGCFPGGH